MDAEWIINQLTEAKKKHPLWYEFATCVAKMFTNHVEPVADRISKMNSYFTMEHEDIQKRIDELGWFFLIGENVSNEDKPLSIMQKLDEIHFKSTDLPMLNTISREFKGLRVEWMPLWSPKGKSEEEAAQLYEISANYKHRRDFERAAQIGDQNVKPENYFMTSRGVIAVGNLDLAEVGFTADEFEQLVDRLIKPLLPVEIVFHGNQLFNEYIMREFPERFTHDETIMESHAMQDRKEGWIGIAYGFDQYVFDNNDKEPDVRVPARFDDFPLDGWTLDILDI